MGKGSQEEMIGVGKGGFNKIECIYVSKEKLRFLNVMCQTEGVCPRVCNMKRKTQVLS